MSKLKDSILTIGWSLKLAFNIKASVLIVWGTISILLAVLPAIALYYNREAVSILSYFLTSGHGGFADIVPSIVTLGVILTTIGLSRRINRDFLYLLMYDAYYFGFQEYMMDSVQEIELKTLMDKEYREQHYASIRRGGALTEFISFGIAFVSKVVGAVSLLFVAAQTSLIVFGAAILYIVAIMVLNVLTVGKFRWDNKEHNAAQRQADYYQESVMTPGVAKELRVYNLGEETISNWEKAYGKAEKFKKRSAKAGGIIDFVSGITFYIFMAGIMAYSIFQISSGTITVDIYLMLYAMGQSISEMSKGLSSGYRQTENAVYSLTKQRKFFTSIPKVVDDWQEGFEQDNADIVFEAENISFAYDDKNNVLTDLSISIKKGETIALVGMNGSGKTTLVKLLIGLFSPQKGTLKFYGKPYDDYTRGALVKNVGMFFQDFYIFHATLRENVGFGDLKSFGNIERIQLAMQKGGADHLPAKFPNGIEQWLVRDIKKDGAILSGGEKQRVAASRAHMSDKDILIFDEPAAALDPIAEMKQFAAIREKIEGRTAILISHRVGFARLADRIIVLDKGRLAESGTHDELMTRNGIYAGFFNEQAGWYGKGSDEE